MAESDESDESDQESARGAQVIRQLRGFLGPRPASPIEERCEFCGQLLPNRHSHVVHIERRNLLCACRPCYLLFSSAGAAGGKAKAVPEEVFDLGTSVFSPAQWDRLQVPVNLAFFFFNSSLGRTVVFYPSPAGATESLLPLETWEELVREHPRLAALSQDVEALLVWQRDTSEEPSAALIVPIDSCYELVGIVRRCWKGFHGGEEAWQAIAAFFSALRARASAA
ncbi:MAG TPA: DUF5947 family protein [Thermoanaerobaculia bacterium]|jgi:hypothetical protein|nr:DUF5947 family protein [Thermoanaerobaculia bacterium]